MNFRNLSKSKALIISLFLIGSLFFLTYNFNKVDYEEEEEKTEHLGFYGIDFDAIFKDKNLIFTDSTKKIIVKYFNKYWEANQLSGGFLVAKGNHIIYENYLGYSNLEKEIPITKETPIHTASITKNITAMAILKLAEANLLKLNDKVSKYLTNFPYQDIAIFDLLTHRSGLNEYGYFAEQAGIWDTSKYLTNQKVLDLYIKHKPVPYSPPNQNFSYCNTNYVFLALIIEKITKKSYPEAMQKMVFEPLGLRNTYVFEKKHFQTASLSYFNNGKLYPWDFRDLVYGDKNIYSTPRDLLKYSQAMFSEKFLRKSLIDSATIGYSNEKKGVKNYGFGFRLFEYDNNKKLTYHNGWWHGNNTVFVHLRDEKVTIIALGNKKSRNIYSANALAALFGDYPISFQLDESGLNTSDTISTRIQKTIRADSLKSKKKIVIEERLTANDSVNQ